MPVTVCRSYGMYVTMYVCVTVVSCRGSEWSTFVRHQWLSVAWYVEMVSPPCECVTYYITEARRTVEISDADSFIACLSALVVLLPRVIDLLLSHLLEIIVGEIAVYLTKL